MTIEDVNKLLGLLKANFSYAFRTMSDSEKTMLVKIWAAALKDVDLDLAMMAAEKIISSSKWMPTVADIRDKVKAICDEAVYTLRESREIGDVLGIQMLPESTMEKLQWIADRAARHKRSTGEISLTALLSAGITDRYMIGGRDGQETV